MHNTFHKSFALKALFAIFSLTFLTCVTANGQIGEIENKIPKNVPLKIEVKNSDSADWVHELEIEVTNTGKKPIYYLFLALTFDLKDEEGITRSFPLIYGNGDLYSTEEVSAAGDSAILPDEKYTFKIQKNSADAWMLRKSLTNFAEPQKAYLKLGWLSFGDGTGIKGGGSVYKKRTN